MITLEPPNSFNRPWLQTAYSLYIHDLSKYGGDYLLDERGVWQPDLLPWWLDHRQPVMVRLIRSGDHYVGFIFSGKAGFPFMSPTCDYKLAECFILSAHRAKGIAQEAVTRLVSNHPGKWELAVLKANQPALRFWNKFLTHYEDLVLIPGDGDTTFQFTVKG